MRSLLRRLTVPLVGAGLVIVVATVALVLLDLGGSTKDGARSLPVIQIGSASATPAVDGTDTTGATMVTAPESPVGEQAQGQGQGSGSGSSSGQGYRPGTTQSQGDTAGPGSTLRGGKTTIVTGSIRVQRGSGPHGGSSAADTSTTTATTTTTTDAENPATKGTDGDSTTSSTQETPSTGGPHGSTSTSSTAGQSPPSTGGSGGGMHGTPSTMRGR